MKINNYLIRKLYVEWYVLFVLIKVYSYCVVFGDWLEG